MVTHKPIIPGCVLEVPAKGKVVLANLGPYNPFRHAHLAVDEFNKLFGTKGCHPSIESAGAFFQNNNDTRLLPHLRTRLIPLDLLMAFDMADKPLGKTIEFKYGNAPRIVFPVPELVGTPNVAFFCAGIRAEHMAQDGSDIMIDSAKLVAEGRVRTVKNLSIRNAAGTVPTPLTPLLYGKLIDTADPEPSYDHFDFDIPFDTAYIGFAVRSLSANFATAFIRNQMLATVPERDYPLIAEFPLEDLTRIHLMDPSGSFFPNDDDHSLNWDPVRQRQRDELTRQRAEEFRQYELQRARFDDRRFDEYSSDDWGSEDF